MSRRTLLAFSPLVLVLISLMLPFAPLGLGGFIIALCTLVLAIVVSIIAAIVVKGRLRIVPLVTIVVIILSAVFLIYALDHVFDGWTF